VKGLSEEEGQNFAVSAHYATKRDVEAVANFLGGCGAGRLYVGLEPNGDIKPCVFFQPAETPSLGMFWKMILNISGTTTNFCVS
jgi:MoaA/NifB/PqqE/SkfB family radical SAM enzyme